jgi:acetoin utilization deacetylase AcuC-like enzyme
MSTAYITHESSQQHAMGPGHPECPDRVLAIENELNTAGLMGMLARHQAPAATKAQLARVHQQDYIEEIFTASPSHGLIYLDTDTAMNAYSLTAAVHAAGAAVQAVDLVMSGQADNAFCNIRPPGHHAGRNRAAGFCIFNNVAVAAAHALEFHGLSRVAIADFDVHHGNGTDEIFNADPRVMLCSTYRHPYYPYEGAQSGNDHIINVPAAQNFAPPSPSTGYPRWKNFSPNCS